MSLKRSVASWGPSGGVGQTPNPGGHRQDRNRASLKTLGVTQLKALKVERNGPTPKSFLGAERGAEGAPLRPQSPHGKRTA